MKVVNRWGRALLLLSLPTAACDAIVGADFDGLGPLPPTGSGGAGASTAGVASGGESRGGSAGSVGESGGVAGMVGVAGRGGDGGSGEAGTSSGGASNGGASGEPAGGATADGGVGNAGESAGGAAGAGGAPDVILPPTDIVINELKGQGNGDDYVELYNPATLPADIGRCYVVDNSNNRVTFPLGAIIAPQSFVVVRLQQPATSGMVTTCFGYSPCYDGVQWGISASGEAIFLHDAGGVLLDTLTYPDEAGPNNVGDGHGFGRIPDGAATTGAILTSPGAPNIAAP